MAKAGGESGIRTSLARDGSVSYRFQHAGVAGNTSDAVALCTLSHAGNIGINRLTIFGPVRYDADNRNHERRGGSQPSFPFGTDRDGTLNVELLGRPYDTNNLEEQSGPLLQAAIVVAPRDGHAESRLSAIPPELRRFDPAMIVTFTPAEQIVADAEMRQRLGMTSMLLFGLTALVLAAVGIYRLLARTGGVKAVTIFTEPAVRPS